MTSLRVSAIATLLPGVLVTVAVASLVWAPLNLTSTYPIKTGIVSLILALIALQSALRHHPFARFGPSNQLTTVRLLIVALLASLIGEPSTSIAAAAVVVVSIVVTVLDGFDGWLARRSQMISDFGARFDMETDALLIQVLAVLVWQYEKAGVWVIASGLLRYLFVAAGWAWSWMTRPLPPRQERKVICVVQISALITAMAPFIRPPLSTAAAAIGLALLSYSFLVDIVWLWRRRGR